jgi:hypothetical protein
MKQRGISLVAVATLAVVISVIAGASYKFLPQLLKLFVPSPARTTTSIFKSPSIYESPGGFDSVR